MHADLGGASGVVVVGAEAVVSGQPPRGEIERQVEQTVREAMEGARQGAEVARGQADAVRRAAETLHREAEAARQAAADASGGDTHVTGGVTITRTGDGNWLVRTSDGGEQVVTGILPAGRAIEALVAEASMPVPLPPEPDRGPPEGVIPLIAIIFACLTAMVIGLPLARGWARRMERRPAAPATPTDLPVRLDRLEQAVEAVAVEMERVAEAQRYSARLLTERLPDAAPQLAEARATARERA